MKHKIIIVLGHLAGILFFLTLPIVLAPEQQMGLASQREVFGYLLMVGFFYLNFYVLIPKFYFKKKYVWFILIILACYIFITFLPQYIFPFADHLGPGPKPGPGPGGVPGSFPPRGSAGPPSPELLRHLGHTVFLFFLVVFVSLAMRINSKWKETEKERIHTELSFLKAQVNPHFLFNTLNSIYSLAIEKSDDTASAIVKLSGMMRYVLHDARQDYVSLERELECISDFIDLQKIRWGDAVKVDYEVEGNPLGKSIAPFILQPFVENAFKHGVSPEEDSEIEIWILIENEALSMEVINDKVSMRATSAYEAKSGLGIENTRLRLDLMYASAYTLNIHEDEKTFRVHLKLNLKS